MFKSHPFTVLLLLGLLYVIVDAKPGDVIADAKSSDDLLTEYSEVTHEEWEAYKKKFDKKYDPTEDLERRKVYDDAKKSIAEHNKKYKAGEVTYSMGINQFADKKQEEHKGCVPPIPGK